jgi:hypothetical protein
VVALEMFKGVQPVARLFVSRQIAAGQPIKKLEQPIVHAPEVAVRHIRPTPLERFSHVVWVIVLFHAPFGCVNGVRRRRVVVVHNALDPPIVHPLHHESAQSFSFHTIGMGAVIARDAAFGLSENAIINYLLLSYIDECNNTFLSVSSMTPGAIERDNGGVGHPLGVIGAALVAEGLNRVKESLLGEVNGAFTGNAQIVPEEYTRNLIDIASIDED